MNQEEQNQQIQELFLLQRVAQRINSILDLDVLLEEIVGDDVLYDNRLSDVNIWLNSSDIIKNNYGTFLHKSETELPLN